MMRTSRVVLALAFSERASVLKGRREETNGLLFCSSFKNTCLALCLAHTRCSLNTLLKGREEL